MTEEKLEKIKSYIKRIGMFSEQLNGSSDEKTLLAYVDCIEDDVIAIKKLLGEGKSIDGTAPENS